MAKTPLTRQAYVDAAFDIIHDVGAEKLSMRKVATVLGVSPMAMYKHFPNKEALLAATLEEVIARADVFPDESLPWDEWVTHVARGMYLALCKETSWVPLLGSLRLGSEAAKVTEAFINKLTRAGFSVELSVQAYYAVIQMAIGAACLRSSFRAKSQEDSGQSRIVMDSSEAGKKMSLTLATIVEQDQLDIGLPLLIDGLRSRLAEKPS